MSCQPPGEDRALVIWIASGFGGGHCGDRPPTTRWQFRADWLTTQKVGFLGHSTRHDLGETDCEPAAEKKTALLPSADRPVDTVGETTTCVMAISVLAATAKRRPMGRSGLSGSERRTAGLNGSGRSPAGAIFASYPLVWWIPDCLQLGRHRRKRTLP